MKQHANFATSVLAWFDQHGRKGLPWQQNITPYRVWLSEIMLQQTQVETVIPYYQKFTSRFNEIEALAAAEIDEVLHLWTGLGYYARARNLHSCAKTLCDQYNGKFPKTLEELKALPGIGPSTAAAIASIAFGQAHAILDGNVKRVLARYHAVGGWPAQTKTQNLLWQKAHAHMPQTRCRDYTQAIMDLGATVCTRSSPKCTSCPLTKGCAALAQDRIKEFPGKKPKKTLPVRDTQMLLIKNDSGDILLELRPPQGIWGGLWSLPELEYQEDAAQYCQARFNCEVKTEQWPTVVHIFSHFKLNIHPQVVELTRQNQQIHAKDTELWFTLQAPQTLGLAAPVKKLLDQATLDQATKTNPKKPPKRGHHVTYRHV